MCNINLCLSSGASVGHAIGTDLCPQSLITDIEQHSTFSQIIVLCFLNTLASCQDRFTCAVWLSLPIVESIMTLLAVCNNEEIDISSSSIVEMYGNTGTFSNKITPY